MDKSLERARAWQRYRRERQPYAYVEPGLEEMFYRVWDIGCEAGRAIERETLQDVLPIEERAS